MKRKIASFLLVFVALLTFSGCSPTTKAYLEDAKKVSQWNNVSLNGDVNLQLTMQGKSLTLPLTIKLDGSDLTKEAPMLAYQVTFGDVKGLDAFAPGEEGKKLNNLLKNKTVAYYLDLKNMKFAYDKKILLDLVQASGGKIPRDLAKIKEDYVGIDLGTLSQTSEQALTMANATNNENMLKVLEKAFSDFNHKAFDFTKDAAGNYHYEVTGPELYDGLLAGAKHFLVKWPSIKGEVSPLLKSLFGEPITDQNIADFKRSLAELEKNGELKKWLSSAKLTEALSFNTDNYKTKGKIDYKTPDNQFALTLTYNFTTKKDDSVKVTMPNSVHYIDYTKLLNNMNGNDNTAVVEVDGKTVADGYVENGYTLVKYRDFAESLDAKVSYDAKRKQVKVSKDKQTITLTLGSKKVLVNDKVKQLSVVPVVKEGATYVPLRFIAETYGYQVNWDNTLNVASLTKTA